MSDDTTFDAPLHGALVLSATTSAGSPEVPGKFDVALNGHGYMIDMDADLQGFRGEHFKRASIPVLRAQADTANTPGEQSINRDSLWRRSQESWHHGAGQNYYDRSDSDPYRFHSSKGVNPWSKWSLSLLNDTSTVRATSNTNLRLASLGTHMYVADGNDLLWTTNLTSYTTVTGTPASAVNAIATDGYTVYAAYGVNLWATLRGASGAGPYATAFPVNLTAVGYVKGRIMVAAGNSLYNITTFGSAPAALLTHPNSDFNWVGFAEGPGHIYAAGYSGNRSLIYATAVLPDGTALGVPSVAGELPLGETIRSIKGYLGQIIVGTDLGFRVGTPDSQGKLTFGSYVPTAAPVLNFEPGDRFLWFGMSNYDSSSTGLGRMDLSVFTDSLVPAYATDLMATGQGAVQSISTFANKRVFTVNGLGVFAETATLVPSGTFTTGRITYGVGDNKVAMFLDLRHQPLTGVITAVLVANATSTIPLGSSDQPGTVSSQYALNAKQTRAEFFEVTFTLTAESSTAGPSVTRTTLRSYPTPSRTLTYTVPLLFHRNIKDLNGSDCDVDVAAERSFIEQLVASGELALYQEGSLSSSVLVDDFDWVPVQRAETRGSFTFEGTMVVTLKEQIS